MLRLEFGLRCPASGTNITTSVDNSKFYITATISTSWGGQASGDATEGASDWGLFIARNNVTGTATGRVGGNPNNTVNRGGAGTWFGSDDQTLHYNPLDSRNFVLQYMDAPGANAGTTLFYSIGVAGDLHVGFPYNRTGAGAGNGQSASTITVMEVVA